MIAQSMSTGKLTNRTSNNYSPEVQTNPYYKAGTILQGCQWLIITTTTAKVKVTTAETAAATMIATERETAIWTTQKEIWLLQQQQQKPAVLHLQQWATREK